MAQNSMACIGKVMTQVWLKFIELFDKQVNAQNKKIFRGSHKLQQAHEKVCDENKTKKK